MSILHAVLISRCLFKSHLALSRLKQKIGVYSNSKDVATPHRIKETIYSVGNWASFPVETLPPKLKRIKELHSKNGFKRAGNLVCEKAKFVSVLMHALQSIGICKIL